MQQLPIAPPVSEDGMLRAELAKWRERVPKLAAALRERTEEVERLRRELETRGEAPAQGPSAGARAREAHMADLEARIDDLRERYKSAQADLHRRQLDIDELRAESREWKDKWQSATRTLDEQAEAVAEAQRRADALQNELAAARQAQADAVACRATEAQALARARADCESLQQRNEQLFETTEMANRQIESLTDSLAELRQARQAAEAARQKAEQALAEANDRADAEAAGLRARAEAELAEVRARADAELAESQVRAEAALAEAHASADARVAELRAEAEAKAADLLARAEAVAGAEHELEQLRASEAASRAEAQRLAGVVDEAQRTVAEREYERRALSEQLQNQEARVRHLEEQLSERSALVVTLEQDHGHATAELERLREEREELEAARLRAERHAKENAEHVAQLDDKLERQKALMDALEGELAEAHRHPAERVRPEPVAAAGQSMEITRLQDQVRKLEQMLRERTEKVNRLEWQRQVDASKPVSESDDGKLLLVLNQQLADAREQNGALLDRIRVLEEAAARGREPDDELLRIHGVGQKLAEQLHALGIHRLQQIAELDHDDLENAAHVLHAHRSRILRDRWIEQAAALSRH
ncbi:MAG: hypothetical protein RIB46_18785 [Pseudomonadales bacterium]